MNTHCPQCGSTSHYQMRTRALLQCKECGKSFSYRSLGPFKNSKLPDEKIRLIIDVYKENIAQSIRSVSLRTDINYRTVHSVIQRYRADGV